MVSESVADARQPAGLLRRLGAVISDSLVVVGMMLLGTLLFVPVLSHLDAKAMTPSEVGWLWSVIYWFWLLSIWMVFFGYFWSRSGQTVGMRAWRLRVENNAGELLTWRQSLIRLWAAVVPWLPCLVTLAVAERLQSNALKYVGEGLSAIGVAALLWMYFDPAKGTWHDRITNSRIILLPKL